MLQTNWIQDFPVIEKDTNTASKIWGPDVVHLKGKTTRKKPKKFMDEVVQTPPELSVRMHEVKIHVDNLCINGMTFLSCAMKPTFHRDTTPLTDATAETLHNALDKITRKLNAVGCVMKMICCDKQFKSSMAEVNITVDHGDTGAHESADEQNNGVTEEWCCIAMHCLPCKTMPEVMIEGLTRETVKFLNVFPVKHGMSSMHSPSMLLGEPKLHHKKHLQHSLGECTQAGLSSQTTNTNVEHTIDRTCLGPAGRMLGGCDFMNLNMGKVMNRQSVTAVPITETVISKMEEMAKKQGINEVKCHHKDTEFILPNAGWKFGEEDEEEDKDYEHQPQDDTKFDHNMFDVEMEESLSDRRQSVDIENAQDIEQDNDHWNDSMTQEF